MTELLEGILSIEDEYFSEELFSLEMDQDVEAIYQGESNIYAY